MISRTCLGLLSTFCHVKTLAKNVDGEQDAIDAQMVLTSFVKDSYDPQRRWELQKSEPANPNATPALAVERNVLIEIDASLKSVLQATVSVVSGTQPQPLMTTPFSS